MSVIKRLRVALKTSSEAGSGTDARVYLVLHTTGAARIYALPARREEMEAGQKDVYDLTLSDGPELDTLAAAALVNGMNGPNPAWKVLWVGVEAVDAQGRGWTLIDAMVERWLDTRPGRAPIAVLPLLAPPRPLTGGFNVDLPGPHVSSL